MLNDFDSGADPLSGKSSMPPNVRHGSSAHATGYLPQGMPVSRGGFVGRRGAGMPMQSLPPGARQSAALQKLRQQIMMMRQGQQPLMNMLGDQSGGGGIAGGGGFAAGAGEQSPMMQMLQQKMQGMPSGAPGTGVSRQQAFMQMLQQKMQGGSSGMPGAGGGGQQAFMQMLQQKMQAVPGSAVSAPAAGLSPSMTNFLQGQPAMPQAQAYPHGLPPGGKFGLLPQPGQASQFKSAPSQPPPGSTKARSPANNASGSKFADLSRQLNSRFGSP